MMLGTRIGCVLAILAAELAAAGPDLAWRRLPAPHGTVVGAALDGRTLFTWGDGAEVRDLPGGSPRPVASGRLFAAGGCALDVDGDGRLDLVVTEAAPQALVWYHAPDWTRRVIDEGIDSPDVIAATFFGRRGVLLIHKRLAVRFYAIPGAPDKPWPVRDLYSVYTPSWQGGLALADVDGDGRMDILCGNYWIRQPESEELPWRLFAINTWTEDEASGLMRLGWAGWLAAAQRGVLDGRVAIFRPPENVRELWPARELGRVNGAGGLVVADLDGDGAADVLVAESGGAGRLLLWRYPEWKPRELRRGMAAVSLELLRTEDQKLPGVVVVTSRTVEYGRVRTR